MKAGDRTEAYRVALQKIADALGVPIEQFLARRRKGRDFEAVDFLQDPHGKRIVAAFMGVEDPAGRRAIADAVIGIAGSFNLRKAAS